MTQDPKEWCIAQMANRQPSIEVDTLRPVALEPYQKAMFDWLQDSTSTTQVTVMATRVGRAPTIFSPEELEIFGLSLEDLPRHTVAVEDLFEAPSLPVVEFKGVYGKGDGA